MKKMRAVTLMIFAVGLLNVAKVIAQDEPAPEPPYSPSGDVGGPPSMPSAPGSEASAPSSNSGTVSAPGVSSGSDSYTQVFSDTPAAEEAPAANTEKVVSGKSAPESYNIQTGDTLWDICQKLLDNPWYWPKLWSLNEYIENPHLIYPGNRVVFYSGSSVSAPSMEVVTEEGAQVTPPAAVAVAETPKTQGNALVSSVPTKMQVKLKSVAFVSEKELSPVGRISHSGEPKKELSAGDHVYLDFYKKRQVQVGDRFQTIRPIKDVDDPDAMFGTLGKLIKKTAVLKVVAIHKNTVEATVTDCEDSFVRGEEFVPYESPIRTLQPHSASKSVEGKIVEAENQQFLISSNDFVYLNMGKKQGLDDGMQLSVVRKGDGVFPGDDEQLPDVVVGRLLVVQANDHTATAYVTDLKDSLIIGDRVRSKVE